MPIYEYRCDACGEELERLQRMNDDRLVDCPACNEPALKRLVSAAAFRLKGSGWYETDFKKDNKRNLADSGSDSGSGSGSGGKESSVKKSSKNDQSKTEKPSSAGADKKAATKATPKSGASSAS